MDAIKFIQLPPILLGESMKISIIGAVCISLVTGAYLADF